MKKIFAFVLSLNLILTPSVAMAEEELYTATGTGSREGITQYLNSVIVTSSGIVGSTLYTCTGHPFTFSHYIFMGGSIALMASEIAKAIQEKEALELKNKQLQNLALASQKPTEGMTQEQKESQLAALETAKSEEERIKEILQSRMGWMTAVEIIYWLAVAGAVTEIIMSKNPQTTYIDNLDCNKDNGKLSDLALKAIVVAYGINPSALATGNWLGVGLQGASSLAYVGALKNSKSFVSKAISTGAQTSISRSITFGVFAGYASYVRTGFKKNKERAEKNIETLNNLINEWKNATVPSTEIDPGEILNPPVDPATLAGQIKPTPVIPLARSKSCISGAGGSFDFSTEACKNPIKFDRSKINFGSPFLKSMSNLSMDMSEALARGDSALAQIAANQLSANASRIKKEVSDLIKKADEKLKKTGSEGLNLSTPIKAQMAALDSDMTKVAANLKIPVQETPSLPSEKLSETTAESLASAPSIGIPAAPETSGILSGDSSEVAATTQQPENIDNFVLEENDVLKKPEVSIFKQLSNRYFLNLPKILERKKVEESAKK
jgi:hypothetical protein